MDIPRNWRLKAQRYRLVGSACPTYGRLTFPPRPVCPHCTAQPRWSAGCELSVIHPSNRIFDIKLMKGG